MKILICTGIYPPQVGGPAQYAKQIEDEFRGAGNSVKILTYNLERKLPTLIRHKLFFLRTLFSLWGVDLVVALDTFSVGWPAVCAANILRKKIIIRTGGDFLWESYVERTGDLVLFKDFYKTSLKKLNLKERIIFLVTRFTLENASAVVFSTKWQRDIFDDAYGLKKQKKLIIENEYKSVVGNFEAKSKTYLWAGRNIKLKNVEALKRAFAEAQKKDSSLNLSLLTDIPKNDLLEKMKECYVVILPSITDISPNFVLDAISFGKPCIVTKENGIGDRIKDISLFIDPLNEEDIKNKILFLADDEHYQEYKQKVANFSFTHTVSDIAKEFLNI